MASQRTSLSNLVHRYVNARTLPWVVLVITVGFVTYRVAQWLTITRIAMAQVEVEPFTLKLDYYDSRANANGGHYLSIIRARRSDGASVEVGNVFGRAGRAAAATIRRIMLPDGELITAHDFVAGYTKWPTMNSLQLARAKEALLTPPANCAAAGETVQGYDTILGYKVVILSMASVNGGKITMWRAPDLLCEPLQNQVEERQSDGSLKVVSEGKAETLTVGQPNPALFEIPANYTSMKPSEAMQKEATAMGIPWSKEIQIEAERQDANYSRTSTRK